jgi:hypothetical protein
MVTILSQINPVHTIPSYLSKIHFNIVLSTSVQVYNCLAVSHILFLSTSKLPKVFKSFNKELGLAHRVQAFSLQPSAVSFSGDKEWKLLDCNCGLQGGR